MIATLNLSMALAVLKQIEADHPKDFLLRRVAEMRAETIKARGGNR